MGTAEPGDAPEVAYCGLVCGPVCCHAIEGCVGCTAGGGAEACTKRECCRAGQIEGCWECADFPRAKGCYGDEAWRGLNVGCVQMVKEMGKTGFGKLVLERLGKGYDYGYLRYQRPEQIEAILRGKTDIPSEDPDLRRQG